MEYARLCEAAGGALAQGGLERAPLLAPLPTAAHAPPAPPAHLGYEERAVVAKALDKLANFPDRTSSLLDVFKVSFQLYKNTCEDCYAGGSASAPFTATAYRVKYFKRRIFFMLHVYLYLYFV